MAHNKFQMTRANQIDTRHSLPVSALEIDYSRQSTSVESQSHEHLSNMLHRLFRVLTRNENRINNNINNENIAIQNNSEIKNDDTQSLLDLEVCANAARETEACGQYEWINTSDE